MRLRVPERVMGVEVPEDENIVGDSKEEGEVGGVSIGGGAGGDVDVY